MRGQVVDLRCSGPDGQLESSGAFRRVPFSLSFDARHPGLGLRTAPGPSRRPRRPRQRWSRSPRGEGGGACVRVKVSHGGTVAGRVTDPDGEPVAGAWVNIDSGYPRPCGPGGGSLHEPDRRPGPLHHHRCTLGRPQGVRLHRLRSRPRVGVVQVTRRHQRGSHDDPDPPGPDDDVSTPSSRRGRTSSGDVVTASGEPPSRATGSVWCLRRSTAATIGDFDVFDGGNTLRPSGTCRQAGFTLRLVNADTGAGHLVRRRSVARDATRVRVTTGGHGEVTIHLP